MLFPNRFRFSILYLLFLAALGQLLDLSVCNRQWAPARISQAVVTFIIPSIGRNSLPRTLYSVLGQTDPRWLALILFDGIVSSSLYLNSSSSCPLPIFYHDLDKDILNDSRICIVHMPPVKRKANCGAEKRNAALSLVSTEWTGFVDDDDLLDAHYIKYLIEHQSQHPAAQCILFRMCQSEKTYTTLYPRYDSNTFFRQEVGISFAVRTSLFSHHGYAFQASNWEDFLFLETLRRNKIPIVLSRHLAYYVRGTNSSECVRQSHLTKTFFLQNDSPNLFLRSSSRLSYQEQHKELQNAKLYECFHRGHGPQQPRFFFTERESLFFQENINGLEQSLRRVLETGCHGHWLNMPNVSIHVIFGARTPPQSAVYIQIQLEQIRSRHFTRSYISKLQHATQIWDFRGEWKDYLFWYNITTPVYFVPTMLMQDIETPHYSCAKRLIKHRNSPNDIDDVNWQDDVFPSDSESYDRDGYPWDTEVRYLVDSLQEHSFLLENYSPYEPFLSQKQHVSQNYQRQSTVSLIPGTIFWLYRHGYYHMCRITQHNNKAEYVQSEVSECVLTVNKRDTSDYCWFRNNETNIHRIYQGGVQGSVKETGHRLCERLLSSDAGETQRDTHDIDVLQFGKIRGSAHNRREEVCDLLAADDTVSVRCVEGAFGPLRDTLVCRARVVLIAHYGDTSVLETHRLDPLLLSGRFVIFETNNETQRVSPLVESLYLRHIKLLPGVAVSHTTTTQGLVQETKRFLRKYLKVEKEEAIETQRDTPVTHGTRSVFRDTFSSETQSLLRHTHRDSDSLATQLRHIQRHNIAFARHMRDTIDPLCFALSQLQVQLQLQHEENLKTHLHHEKNHHLKRIMKRFGRNKLKTLHLYETEHIVAAPLRNPSVVWLTLSSLFFLYMIAKFAIFYRYV